MDPEFLHDLFSAFRPVTVRRMFGGAGIYADGVMFGLVADGAIYLKADAGNEADFEREKMPPFEYQAKSGKRAVMTYRQMPERLFDDPEALTQWASHALAAAQRQKQSAVGPRRATPAKSKAKTGTKR